MPTSVAKQGNFRAYGFNSVALGLGFDNVASVTNGVANTTIQARIPIVQRCKIPKVSVNYSAIASTEGNHLFNIVLGNGTYTTGGTKAAATTTASGTPNHDGTVTVTVGGHAVVYTETSGDTSVTALMGHVVTAVNADTTAKELVLASNTAGAFTLTALANGVDGNLITVSISSTDSAPLAFTAWGPTLSGGTNDSSTLVVPDDTTGYTGPIAVAVPGGIAPPQMGVNGDALFATDQALTSAADTPQEFIPTNYDGVIEQGTLLTLRVITPATVGSITNLKVTLCAVAIDPCLPAGYPEALWAVPNATPGGPGW